jgi:hypothetical protein
MAATDYLSGIYDQAWAALEAHTPWTNIVLAANRIKLDDANPDPTKNSWNDSDFPEATLLFGELNDSMFTLAKRYDFTPTFDPTANAGGWVEQIQTSLVLILIHKDLRKSAATMLKLETLTALRKQTGAPRFGKSYVQSFGPVTALPDQIIAGRTADFGPESEAEMRRAAQQILNARMQLEWYESGESPDWINPAYRVDTVESQGFSDAGVQPVGMWKPPNARPITMPEPPAEPAPQP